MPIVMYLGGDIKEYEDKSEEIIRQAIKEDRLLCGKCFKAMAVHSHYIRGIKETGERIKITMIWCSKCEDWHALLPDFLLPHKHYSGNEVESVIIDSTMEPVSRIETEASESTVRRWIKQIGNRIAQAVGILKYLFGKARRAVSEIMIDQGSCYDELEQVLEMSPREIKCSGNKLGMANIWLRSSGMAVFI